MKAGSDALKNQFASGEKTESQVEENKDGSGWFASATNAPNQATNKVMTIIGEEKKEGEEEEETEPMRQP